jgi:hypothetical protein
MFNIAVPPTPDSQAGMVMKIGDDSLLTSGGLGLQPPLEERARMENMNSLWGIAHGDCITLPHVSGLLLCLSHSIYHKTAVILILVRTTGSWTWNNIQSTFAFSDRGRASSKRLKFARDQRR